MDIHIRWVDTYELFLVHFGVPSRGFMSFVKRWVLALAIYVEFFVRADVWLDLGTQVECRAVRMFTPRVGFEHDLSVTGVKLPLCHAIKARNSCSDVHALLEAKHVMVLVVEILDTC